jgi:hypothetical protein
MSAGAYGMAMASNYNTRPRAVEVMVDGDRILSFASAKPSSNSTPAKASSRK